MKINYNYIKAVLLLAVVFFLFAFAKKRNQGRNISKIEIQFTNSENLYITEKAVNKLLIQNKVEVGSVGKEALDLNMLEKQLGENPMIEDAELFVSVDGKLGARLTQRKPIGRILGKENYYMDRNGLKMPLSEFYSARVPIITGVSEENLNEVFPLVDYVRKDIFLSRQIIGIQRLASGDYDLQLREMDFKVFFGKPKYIENKFNNFKAFYQKAMKDKKLNTYKKVNLRFGNQVVCTKK